MAYVNSTATTFKGGGQALSFKCGSQAALEAYIKGTKTAQDGTFYLTNDTSRLYIGNNGKAIPVNQGVITVESVSALPTTGEHGQFYYAESENILCVYAGKGSDNTASGWVQINTNTNTEIKTYTKEVTASTNGVVVTDTITDSNNTPFTDSIEFVEGDGIVLTADATNDKITIAAETSTLGTNANTTNGEIKLSGHDSGTVKFAVNKGSSTNGFVSDANGNVTLNLVNHDLASADFAANTGNGFNLELKLADNTPINSGTDLDPIISYDGHDVHFVNGTATLNVYDKDSIDAKFEGFNAMHYIGTVGSDGSAGSGVSGLTAGTSGVSKVSTIVDGPSTYKIGDTFLVVSNVGDGDNAILAGSLLIAMSSGKGTADDPKEDANGNIPANKLYFEVVNESYEQDTTYKFAKGTATNGGKVTLQPSVGQAAGSISVVGDGTHITGAISGTDPNATITLSHKELSVDRTTNGSATVNSNESFTVIDSIEDDEHGHISSINTKTVTLADFNAGVYANTLTTEASKSGNVAVGTVSHEITVKTGTAPNETAKGAASFVLTSDTFAITNDDSTVANTEGLKINMVWGSFE